MYTLLVPAMLDAHFPILKYAFYSDEYEPVILENEEKITEDGLHYVNNDMCYPAILNVGQIVAALKSGQYDLNKTLVLMPTAGDACRGSNYTSVLRRAIKNAGFDTVRVVSLNLKGIEKDDMMHIKPLMVWKALFGLFYGDILMLLVNQVRPNEAKPGAADECWKKWIDILAEDMTKNKNLTLRAMKRNFYRIAEDFSKIELQPVKRERIGIIGELYIKYCHLGNWNAIKTIEEEGCESHTNGLSWYAIYYMDSHMTSSPTLESFIYRIGIKFFGNLQREMIKALRKYGFYTLEEFSVLKAEAAPYINMNDTVGDGWLIGAEAVGHILHDCPKVLAVQPFGCMPNQISGRGLYPHINRELAPGHIVSVDVDSSASKLNAYNRIKMLIDMKQKTE